MWGRMTLTIGNAEQPTLDSVLRSLSQERLYDLGRVLVARIRQNRAAKAEVATLSGAR